MVENYFSSIRGLGGPNEHPDRLQVYERAKIKLLALEADHIVPINKPSVEQENNNVDSEEEEETGVRWSADALDASTSANSN